MSSMKQRILGHWGGKDGYRETLKVALPLILSTASYSVLHYVDRVMLTWLSPDAAAASMPAGIFNFTTMSIFLGTAAYCSTFVAQYHGANRKERIGPTIWQGVYIAIVAAVLHLILRQFAPPIFKLVGHQKSLQ